MKNNDKIGICLVAVIFIFSTLLMPNLAFAQQDQGQQSVRIIVTDGVTGKAAEGVTTLIRSPSGALIQNLGTVPQGGTVVSLASGQYTVVVQIGIFGFPATLASYSFSTPQATQVELTVSALFIPIQYLPLLIYIVVLIIILVIIIVVIRQILKPKKPVPAPGGGGTTEAAAAK